MIARIFPSSNRQGSALITVLACLIFVSVLMVAFMMSMRTQVQISRSSSDLNDARLLADTSVNIVVSQIREATSRAGLEGLAWASQPGMIRLYSGTGAAGYFKLYSSDSMTGTSAFNPFAASEIVPPGWTNSPSVYTDLNDPVSGIYPILNPNAIDPNPGSAGTGASSSAIDEFTVTSAPAANGNPVPMPVRWLYVLADGTVHPPSAASIGERAVISDATASNPIIGRIAFWADDETCKVNINTASVAKASTANTPGPSSPLTYKMDDYNTFWDVPRFSAPAEFNFAHQQPAQGEYQRYPGHPATVGLNAVLPNSTLEEIFQIAPRYAYDGSKGGTVNFGQAQWVDRNTLADRLYASVDELIFNTNVTSSTRSTQTGLTRDKLQAAQFFLTSSSRAPELNLFGQPRISIWPLDTTINSPTSQRVTALDRLIAFCTTISRGATAKPFYFTRQNALSTTTDIALPRNKMLLDYLDAITVKPIPGFGGSFQSASKYGQPETRQILTEIFDYIRTTNTEDSLVSPANMFAATPTTGWGFGKGQVAPSIRSDWQTQGFGSFWRPVEVSLQFVGLGDGPLSAKTTAPTALAQPGIPIPDAQIDFPAVGQDATITKRNIDPSNPASPLGWMPPDNNRAVQAFVLVSFVNPAHCRIDGSAVFWMKVSGLDSMTVSDDVTPPTSTKPMGFPSSASFLVGANTPGDDLGTGIFFGYLPFTAMVGAGGKTTVLGPQFPFFSQIVPIPINRESNAAPGFQFSGGTLTIELYDISAGPNLTNPTPSALPAGANKVQTFTVTFPATSLPMPGITKIPIIGTAPTFIAQTPKPLNPPTDAWGRISTLDRWRMGRNNNNIQFGGFSPLYGRTLVDLTGVPDMAGRTASDVVQSMVLSSDWSDARLLASGSPVPASAFEAHPRYGLDAMANDQRMGGAPLSCNNGLLGKLVAGTLYNRPNHDFLTLRVSGNEFGFFAGNPVIPPTQTGVTGWDWDNGVGNYPDGPWINKADEGSIAAVGQRPYYQAGTSFAPTGPSFFSPNRQVSSPGMFGSLSTGVSRHQAWQTLLFRPGNTGHTGSETPRDHLVMDLFWMPVVEPYAISEPFSTAGKINLNQQLIPFTYINRYTALRAAMMGEKVAKMPKSAASSPVYNYFPTYKSPFNDSAALSLDSRLPINLSESTGTLKQLVDKFASGEIYKSATEICDLHLVPEGYTWPEFQNQWYGDDFALVGDNVREKPYSNLYGKLTTKSNSFLVHYRVQALRQTTPNLKADPTIFDPSRGDKVVAEQRGSATVERYLDPSDTRFSPAPAGFFDDPAVNFFDDPAANTSGFSLESYYRTRVYNSKIFNP